MTYPTVDLTMSLLEAAEDVDEAVLLPALATVLGVAQSRLQLLAVATPGDSTAQQQSRLHATTEPSSVIVVRIIRTADATAGSLPSFAAAEQFIESWNSHDDSVFGDTFPYTVDPDVPPTYEVLDTSDKKEKKKGDDDDEEPWWKLDKLQAGIVVVVVVVIVGAIIGIVVWRRRRGAQNGMSTNRDSAIYTYPSLPSANAGSSRKPQFHGSAL